tara:strand:- start:275 stop:454 length:180 start_codon:yes stop_codon:yes gene_type:complete
MLNFSRGIYQNNNIQTRGEIKSMASDLSGLLNKEDKDKTALTRYGIDYLLALLSDQRRV